MRKVNIFRFWIFTGTIVLMIIFIFAVFKIYQLTLNDAKMNHQLQQMEMAKAATTGISYFLEHLAEDMDILNFFPGLRSLNEEFIHLNVNYLLNHHRGEVIKSIFITDLNAEIVYSNGDSLPEWIAPLVSKQIEWAKRPENRVNCWYSQVRLTNENEIDKGFSFIMLTPILQEEKGTIDQDLSITVIGLIGQVVNFDLLVNKFIEPLNLSNNDFAWIIDGNGRLIFHPSHKEMLMRSTLAATPECSSCHSSFDVQNKMLTGGPSIGEYLIANEPAKVMAYAPVQLQNEKWVLVISTFLPEVTANLRDKFRLFFILGVIILGVILVLGLSLYYVNTKRIRAEEAKSQSEQMRQLQLQLSHASKLASIGELVDTVAHEINTPTGIIAAHADAILLQSNQEDIYSEELGIIKKQTRRIHEYTRSLLGYSKRVPFNPQPIKINKIIEECVYLLGHRFRAQQISVSYKHSDDLPQIIVDQGQIEQVFINLLNNAVDAIEGPGMIKIETSFAHRKTKLEGNIIPEGMAVSITDNGKGIIQSKLAQIFEPFFSTKLPTEGTGLGLYISKSIIQRHRGKIEVSSKIGEGTTFNIFLPLNIKWDK
jgi:signal transduction histidine kinase